MTCAMICCTVLWDAMGGYQMLCLALPQEPTVQQLVHAWVDGKVHLRGKETETETESEGGQREEGGRERAHTNKRVCVRLHE